MNVVRSIRRLHNSRGESGFGYYSTCDEVTRGLDLTGRTVLVTGCNSGLGKETMRVMCDRGARVIGAARTLESAMSACAHVPEGRASAVACDLSEPASILGAITSVQKMKCTIDAIVANAGVMAPADLVQSHGYELQFFTNHVGHHLLVTRLLHQLSETGRVVVLSSSAHRNAPPEGIQFGNLSGEKGYAPWTAYGQSKLANLLFARHLTTRLPKPGQTANAVHPGIVKTNLQRHLRSAVRGVYVTIGPLFFKNVQQGASTQCYVAVHPSASTARGEYFADCNIAQPGDRATDASLAATLWEVTEEIIARFV